MLTKSAGRWSVEAFTDGYPTSIVLSDLASDPNPCEQTKLRLRPEDLRDLIYCGERILALIEAKRGGKDAD